MTSLIESCPSSRSTYYPDQGLALDEVFRVLAPGGRLFILINLYTDNEYSLQWVDKLKVPVRVPSSAGSASSSGVCNTNASGTKPPNSASARSMNIVFAKSAW